MAPVGGPDGSARGAGAIRIEPLDAPVRDRTEPGASSWTPSQVLGRARELRRRDGARRVLSGIGAELGYRRLLVFERRLDSVRAPAAVTGLSFGTIEEFDDYSRLRDDLDREAFGERIRSGAVALCAREGGAPVSVTWAAVGAAPLPYLGARVRSDEGSVWLVDTLTRPDRRGLGVLPALAEWAAARYADDGRRRIVTTILPENRRSRHAHTTSGFEPIALAARVGIGRRALLFVRPLAPWEG